MNNLSSDPFRPLDGSARPAAGSHPPEDWTPVLPVPDEAPRKIPRHRNGKPTQTWAYRDAQGQLLFLVCRFGLADGGKDILPLTFCRHADGRMEWRWKGLAAPRPLYGLDRLAARPDAPVLICEGEKTTDAAAILLPDHVAITSPNGAKAADKADWSVLSGRRVIVWPDHDEEGRTYAAAATRLALSAGADSVAVVVLPDSFPEKWDLADDLPSGVTGPDLRQLLDGAKQPAASQSPAKTTAPASFRMTKAGLMWVPDDPEKLPMRISGPFEVLAETRDAHGNSWGVLMAWNDNDGRAHQWALPRSLLAGNAAEVHAQLLDGGLYVSPSMSGRNRLNEYLLSVRSEARARCVDMVGWHGSSYVTPSRVYGAHGAEQVILQTAGGVADFEQAGTLADWKREIAAYAQGNSRLTLAICAALAGPLLMLVNEDSFGFHFSGGSSSGKTTALRVASSVWGCPINTWRLTDNGGEGLARAANDGLLLLDELSQVDGRAADAMAYMLGNGQGKSRMRKDATAKPVASWRLVFLSTGEMGLADKVAEAGKKAKAGQAVRMIEIPSDAGKGFRLFDCLHGFTGGDALAHHLRVSCDQFRGYAAPAMLKAVSAMTPATADTLKDEVTAWKARFLPQGADGQVIRVASRFALAAAAGKLGVAIGLLPWEEQWVDEAISQCFSAWITHRGGCGAAETQTGLEQVRAFIEAHGGSRFTALDCDTGPTATTFNRAGFRRRDGQSRWEYLVLPQVWKDEVCKGLNAGAVAQEMIDRGLIVPGTGGRQARLERIPGHGPVRVYQISSEIMADG